MATSTVSSLVPAATPPPGQVSDFNTPDNLYDWNIVVQTVCIVIPSVFMATRCVVRLFILKKWNLEDWLCLSSWTAFLCYTSVVAYVMTHGGGIHTWNLTRQMVETVLFWNNVAQIVYSMSILITKLSLLYLYLGIFAPQRRTGNWWVIIIIMVANAIFYWGLMFAKIFQCWPREAIWDKTITTAKCASLVGILDASGAWNTLSDVTILCVPLLFIWKLQLSREKRIGIIAIFAVGVIAPIFSIIGVVIRVQTSASTDLTYYQPRLLFFAEAEITSGIICTCLPCLPRLFKWFKGEKQPTVSRSNDRSYGYYNNARRRTLLRNGPSGTNPGSDKRFLTSDYMELDDAMMNGGHHVQTPAAAVTTDIKAGSIRGRGMFGAGGMELGQGQIWKTTEVSVQREEANSMSDNERGMERQVV